MERPRCGPRRGRRCGHGPVVERRRRPDPGRGRRSRGGHGPILARWLIGWLAPGRFREAIVGDLEEEFHDRAAEAPWRARIWYWGQLLSPDVLRLRGVAGGGRPGPSRRLPRIETVVLDLRYALRTLRNQPLLTAAVVLMLSIGIGTPTSVFSLLNGFVFRTPASREPESFFRVTRPDGRSGGVATLPQYLALRDGSESARALAAWSTIDLSAPLGPGDPAGVPGLLVTCNFFHLFGVDVPLAGRLLAPDDCTPGSTVAVVSERLWRGRFAGDPSVVGTTLRYGGVPLTVVGVAPAPLVQREAHDPDPDFVADLWFPYTARPELKETSTFGGHFLGQESFPWLEIAGLLEPGISREAAAAEFRLIERRQAASESSEEAPVVLTDGSRWAATPRKLLHLFAMALALPALVMLMASVNVAALLLSRAVGRQRLMAVRLALGTSRAALVRMLLVESFLVSGLAALVSLLLVYRLPPILVRFFEAELWFGAADALRPDWRAFAFLGVSGLLAAVLSGLTPALESLNPRLAESLQGRRGFVSRRGTSRTRRLFVGIQVAASIVPLVAAVTFARTATRFTDPGLRTEGLLVAEVRAEQERGVPLASVAGSIAAAAGVESVAYAETLPLVWEGTMQVRVPGRAGAIYPMAASVSAGYFDLFAIPIVAGRSFEASDAGRAADPKPVVVSRRLARRLFGTGPAAEAPGDVLGEIIETAGRSGGEPMVIVGITADRPTGLAATSSALDDGSMIYELMEPSSLSGFLLVKVARRIEALDQDNAAAMADGLRARLRELTGSATSVRTFESILADEVVGVRRVQTLLLALGVVALVLAIIGVVGIVSFDASQRRKEFAIRLALGAGPWAVRRGVVLSGLRPVPAGIFFGLLASWGALRAVESRRLLPLGSVAGDAGPYLAISAFLLAVALGTLLTVAYPVGRRDPLESLRQE